MRGVIYRCHQTYSSNNLNKIKMLCNEGKEMDAIDQYFKKPSLFAAAFLIKRQNNIDMSIKIYQAAKNNPSLDFLVTMSLIIALEKRNEKNNIIDTVLDDSIVEINKMQAKDITRIEPRNWGFILKTLFKTSREKDIINLISIIGKYGVKLDIRF
jgi:hypothetical protein